jgi:hypothetical protein
MTSEASTEPEYRIRVRGRLGTTMLRAFPTFRAVPDGEDTVLVGPLQDQAALHGVLSAVASLGSS